METTPKSPKRSVLARHGRALVIGTATVPFILGIGLVTAVAGSSPRSSDPPQPATVSPSAPGTVSPSAPGTVSPEPAPDDTRTSEPSPEPTSEPSQEPAGAFDLADGRYPAFVRDVDVRGATVTLDLIQVFNGSAARRAALEDGVEARDARYIDIYVRNENDLLRTIPVARDVRVHFMGVCETPPTRHAALAELRKETTPYDETFYYSVLLIGGEVGRMAQHIAVVGC